MRTITLDNSRGDFSPRDQTYIKLLERYKPFWVMIDKARLDIGIKRGHYLTKYKTETIYMKAQDSAQDMILIFNLPESWHHPLSDFIVTNKLYSPGTGLYLFSHPWGSHTRSHTRGVI